MNSQEEALAIRRRALPKDDPDIAASLINLGLVHSDLRDYMAARQSYEEALLINRKGLPPDHPHVARALLALGLLDLSSGADVANAVRRLKEATDIYQADQDRLAVAQAEREQLMSAAFLHVVLDSLLAAAVRSRVDPAPVYDRVVRVKGSVTAQQRWARQLRDVADPETLRLLDRLRQTSQQLVGLSPASRLGASAARGNKDSVALIRELSAGRIQLERKLSERSPIYRVLQERARIGSEGVQAALPGDTALVDFVEYSYEVPSARELKRPSLEIQLVAFVVRPDHKGVAMVHLGPSQAVAKLIEGWRASYGAGKRSPADIGDPGLALRQKVWEPLARHLQGVKVVLLSPDGPLNGLLWAALPGSKEGTFLVHECAFAVVPVPQLLPELLRTGTGQTADPASLVVGNIDFDAVSGASGETKRDNRFPALPGSQAESAAVHDLFRTTFAGRPAELLRGKFATKEAFVSLAPKCSHLLVATHGFFLPDAEQKESSVQGNIRSLETLLRCPDQVTANPALRSGLVFARANYEATGKGTAFLTALEAAELDLHKVDLAVLSACETGLGKLQGGEGVLGLQRAFQLAGARTAVTSLWKVPDAATQALMTRFHRNLWEKKMAKLEALREAQLWMIEEGWKHPELGLRGGLVRPEQKPKEGEPVSPFYWAAFVLSGDWR